MNSRGSWLLGTYFGIPLKLHWTFALTFLLIIGGGMYLKRSSTEIFIIIVLTIIGFVCVTLHEYGHALMAKRLKVDTLDIILSPIGGLARLAYMPQKPIQEFYIAIAGPLVNAGIAGILALILKISSKPLWLNMNGPVEQLNNWSAYMSLIMVMNLVLFLFNLIPAFPMDGGRVLRALLSMSLGKVRSTYIAVFVGYFLAVGFIVYSIIYQHPVLLVIGFFVIIMARAEITNVSKMHKPKTLEKSSEDGSI